MKIIKINIDHYVVVDDSEIRQACYVYKSHENIHGRGIFFLPADTDFVAFNKEAKDVSVITHSTQPMPHGSVREGQVTGITAISLQEVKELIGEVDVEKKATDYSKTNSKIESTGAEEFGRYWGFKEGYNQALEDNKEKKYTEEDLLKFTEWVETSQEASDYDKKNRMRFAPKMEGNSEVKKRLPELYSLYTQSLQPKTEWEVEIVDGKLKLK